MRNSSQWQGRIVALAYEAGLTEVQSGHAKKHLQLKATNGNGEERKFHFSKTPGDYRAILNFRAELRRFAKTGEKA